MESSRNNISTRLHKKRLHNTARARAGAQVFNKKSQQASKQRNEQAITQACFTPTSKQSSKNPRYKREQHTCASKSALVNIDNKTKKQRSNDESSTPKAKTIHARQGQKPAGIRSKLQSNKTGRTRPLAATARQLHEGVQCKAALTRAQPPATKKTQGNSVLLYVFASWTLRNI